MGLRTQARQLNNLRLEQTLFHYFIYTQRVSAKSFDQLMIMQFFTEHEGSSSQPLTLSPLQERTVHETHR